ncbi:MAG: helix-turn-helix transcriptional regulator [Planctomycetota bacterium]
MRRAIHSDEQSAGHQLFDGPDWEQLGERLALSPRELEIAQGVFDDQLEAAIARRLGISVHTVHTHLGRLYHKLGVSSRVELVVRLVQCHHTLCRESIGAFSPICSKWESGDCPFSEEAENRRRAPRNHESS